MSPTPPSKAPAHWQEVAPSVMPCLPRDHPPLPDLIPATLLQPAFPDPFSGWKSTLSSHAHSLSSKRTFWKEHTLAPLSTPGGPVHPPQGPRPTSLRPSLSPPGHTSQAWEGSLNLVRSHLSKKKRLRSAIVVSLRAGTRLPPHVAHKSSTSVCSGLVCRCPLAWGYVRMCGSGR